MQNSSGDGGKTRNFRGEKIAKNSAEIEFLGALDELFAVLQICAPRKLNFKNEKSLRTILEIFPQILESVSRGADFPANEIFEKMENEIAEIEKKFAVKNFQTFTNSSNAAILNFARTVARRAERAFFATEIVAPNLGKFLNRISKFLFFLAVRENLKS